MTTTKACTKCLLELGLDRFSTDRAKKDGLSCACKGCASKRYATYSLAHAEENRARAAKWLAENPERAAATHAAYHLKHKEKRNARSAKWRADNLDRSRELSRRWDAAHSERNLETRREYRAENPEKFAEYRRTRAARIRQGTTDPVPFDIKAQLIAAYGPTCMKPGCENTDLTTDHIVPLAMDGAHNVSNLQILCSTCNSRKGDRATTDYRPAGIERSVQL